MSGINLGLNLGDDVTYSGTVAAALEGTLLGIPALAVSAHAVNDERPTSGTTAPTTSAPPRPSPPPLAPRVLEPDFPERVVLNINAPGLPPEAVTGAEVTRLGRRQYNDELTLLDEQDGRRRYTIYGGIALAPPRGGHRLRRDRGRRHLGHAAALRPHGPRRAWSAVEALQLAGAARRGRRCRGARDRLRPDPARPGRHGDRLRGAHPRVPPARRARPCWARTGRTSASSPTSAGP